MIYWFMITIVFILWLAYPGAHSHHMLMSKVGRELVSRGHQVKFWSRYQIDSRKKKPIFSRSKYRINCVNYFLLIHSPFCTEVCMLHCFLEFRRVPTLWLAVDRTRFLLLLLVCFFFPPTIILRHLSLFWFYIFFVVQNIGSFRSKRSWCSTECE